MVKQTLNFLLFFLLIFSFTLVSAEISKWDNDQSANAITGDCPDGYAVQNITTGGIECIEMPTGGSISVNSTQFSDDNPLTINQTWLSSFIEGISKWGNYWTKTENINQTGYNISADRVFIGNVTPAGYLLDVAGVARWTQIGNNGYGEILYSTPSSQTGILLRADNVSKQRADIRRGPETFSLLVSSDNSIPNENNGIIIANNGDVGLGTTAPVEKLNVIGKIYSGNGGANAGLVLGGTTSETNAFPTNSPNSFIYYSGTTVGTYPFNAVGNLVLQPRTSSGGRAIVFATGSTTPSVRAVITSAGNVGIGTITPVKNLHLYGADTRVYIQGAASGNTPGVEMAFDNTSTRRTLIQTGATGTLGAELRFWTKPDSATGITQRMVIDNAGKVGINTTTPVYPLDINSSVSGISIYTSGNISSTGYITRTETYDKSKGKALDFAKDSSEYLTIDGKINHSAFKYSYVNYTTKEIVGYTNETQEIEVCDEPNEEEQGIIEEGLDFLKGLFTPKCRIETIQVEVPIYEDKLNEGVSLNAEVALLKQQVYELKKELELLKNK
jgi:hypothetical protein